LAPIRESLETRVGLHPFLCGMSRPHLELLTGCAMEKTFPAGEVIFHQGDCANRFYLIETGKIALQSTTREEPLVIEIVGPGSLIGWSWLFPPYVWFFDAVAKEETRALFFYGTILREYCEKDSSLGYELFKRMSQVMVARLQAARGKLVAG
jgi:CRP/FNR family cyclic AMP-dependent transcriptional regulator